MQVHRALSGRRPRVSVVTIFLNESRFIREAVESVLAQSYDSWELILVDDGSTDASSTVARDYAARYASHIRYVEHEGHANRGMSASRNLGIAFAAGELIAFLDADDAWPTDVLARQVRSLDAQPTASLAYGASKWWFSWTGEPADQSRDGIDFMDGPSLRRAAVYGPPTLLTLLLRDGARAPCPCSIIVRRSAVDRVGGFEASFRGLYEDQVFLAKICLTEIVYGVNECWGWYRQHPDSCCATAARNGTERVARADYLHWLSGRLIDSGIHDDNLRHALAEELRALPSIK